MRAGISSSRRCGGDEAYTVLYVDHRMFRIICALLIALSLAVAARGQQSSAPIASVEALIHSQRYDEALQMTESGLRERPADFRLWTLKGIILSITGKNPDAIAAFQKALRLSPGYPAALKGEVQVLYQAQDQRAVPLLRQIIKADPQDATAHEMLAFMERKKGNCGTANDEFRLSGEVIDTHPNSLEAYADCLVQAGELKEAIPVLEKLSSLLPDRNYPKYDMAVLLVETKQNDAALKILEPMIAEDSSDPDLLSLASEAYEAAGNTPKAVALLRQAIVLNPRNANYYLAFASLCLSHSSFQVGIDMIDAGMKRIPNDASLYISRGLLYAQLAEYDRAEDDFNTAERLNSTQSLSSYAIDLAEIEKNQNDKALANIRAQLKSHPESPWLHYALARLLDNKGAAADASSTAEALRAAQEAVKLKPDFVEARNLLASMYIHSEQYDGAIEQSRRVLESDPSNESAIYHLIIALRRSGKSGEDGDIQQLSKQLADLQKGSFKKEIESNRYKLVEQVSSPPSRQ